MYQVTRKGLEDVHFHFIETTITEAMKETRLLPASVRFILFKDLQRLLNSNCSSDVIEAMSKGILLGLLFGSKLQEVSQ